MTIIRVISLTTDTQRRFQISNLLKAEKFEYKFIDAINGKNLKADEYWRLMRNSDPLFNRRIFLTPTEVGCKLSHVAALEDYLTTKNTEEPVIILEDDVFPNALRTAFVGIYNVLKSFGDEPVIIHLGGQDGLRNSTRVIKLRRPMLEAIASDAFAIFEPIRFSTRWLYRTCAYAANREGAKHLLSAYNDMNIPADNWRAVLKCNRHLRLLFCDLVRHPTDLSSSHIERERNFKKTGKKSV